MFQSLICLTLLSAISASHYGGYENNGYNNYHGFKKVGYGSYQYGSGGYHGNNYGGYGMGGYGHGHGYGGWPSYHHYKSPFVIVKRLPPIYKDVKQPVYIEQPVIIRKIPVIHKKKEVTVKKQPPIYDINPMQTVVEKDVGYPKYDYKPMMGGDEGMGKGMKDIPMMTDYEDNGSKDDGKSMDEPLESDYEGSEGMFDIEGEGKDMDQEKDVDMKDMKDVMIDMKDMDKKPSDGGAGGDEGFSDFNPKDFGFDSQKYKA